jgi:threonine aldolase
MRQAGIIAAAGINALEQMVDRLADDHKNAKRLANAIAGIDGLKIDLASVRTDIVYFEIACERITAEKLVDELNKRAVKILHLGPNRLRAVTHYGITAEDIDAAADAIRDVLRLA